MLDHIMMTSPAIHVASLWLLVVELGLAAGAGLYEHRIVIPRWHRSPHDGGAGWNAEAAVQDDTGRRFWGPVTTVPLTLLVLANLAPAWHAAPDVRVWWLSAVAAALLDRVLTFSYFIPTMVRLMNGTVPSGVASLTAVRWNRLNYLRHVLVGAAWLAAMRAGVLLG